VLNVDPLVVGLKVFRVRIRFDGLDPWLGSLRTLEHLERLVVLLLSGFISEFAWRQTHQPHLALHHLLVSHTGSRFWTSSNAADLLGSECVSIVGLPFEGQLVNWILGSLLNQVVRMTPVWEFITILATLLKRDRWFLIFYFRFGLGNNCKGFEVYSCSSLHIHIVRVNNFVLFLQIKCLILGEVGSFSFSLLGSILLLILGDDVGWVGVLDKPINYSFLSLQLLLWLS